MSRSSWAGVSRADVKEAKKLLNPTKAYQPDPLKNTNSIDPISIDL